MTARGDRGAIVDPGLYSRDYFLSDNEGWREYALDLDRNVHPKYARALEIARASDKDVVLDIGCGRGELLYYSARRGARAVGIDYSPAAVDIARKTIQRLPPEQRALARAEVADPAGFISAEKFTIIFMIETFEHMHDWQLRETFARLGGLLADGGRIIIMTPNYYFERYLSPMKRLLNLPLNLIKLPFRLLKKRYREAGVAALFRRAFRIWPDRGDLNRAMHVNVATPKKVRSSLSGFKASVWCEDGSLNPLSLLTRRWWGRDIIAVAIKS
jgi:SAM-dependent methyltransferase